MGMMGPCLWQLLNSGAKNAFRSSELRMSFWEKSISLSTTHNESKPPTAMLMETRMNLLFHVVQRWEPFPQFLSIFLPFFSPWFMVGHKKKAFAGVHIMSNMILQKIFQTSRKWPCCRFDSFSFCFKGFFSFAVEQPETGVQDKDLELHNYIPSINQPKKTMLLPYRKCSVGQDKWNWVWTTDSMPQIYYKTCAKIKEFGLFSPLGKKKKKEIWDE